MSIRMRWLAAPVVAGAAIVATAASAFAAAGPVVQRVKSPTWAGYAVTGAPGAFKSVSASWFVPAVNGCAPTGEQVTVAWVGLDGAGVANGHVQQVGTEQACENGTPVYQVFYEMAPAPPKFAFAVHPGDQVRAGVVSLGESRYLLYLHDQTTGQSFHTVTTAAPSLLPFDQSAEAVFETATMAIPNVDGVTFHNVRVNGRALDREPALVAIALFRHGLTVPVYLVTLPPTAPGDFTVYRAGHPPVATPAPTGRDGDDGSDDLQNGGGDYTAND